MVPLKKEAKTSRKIPIVHGDGSGPEMMAVACRVTGIAALLDNLHIQWVPAPMGWCMYNIAQTTLPESSLNLVQKHGIVFFGGVGDPKLDQTLGKQNPSMRPETKCLLGIRQLLGLLVNTRPVIFNPALRHLAHAKPEDIGDEIIEQIWLRCLLEGSYFSEVLAAKLIPDPEERRRLGLVPKSEVAADMDMVVELSYYSRPSLLQYFTYAYNLARSMRMPLTRIHKANINPRYQFFAEVGREVGLSYPDVEQRELIIDAANSMLCVPKTLRGVLVCGNMQGDIITDGAAGVWGSMGMMYSSAINPSRGWAMFESGAGTAPTLAGQNIANPLGRIMAGALMLDHLVATELEHDHSYGGDAIRLAVNQFLADGWVTQDLASPDTPAEKILGTRETGDKIIEYLAAK